MKNKIVQNSCIALIPARGGSKGVPHKNIKLLKGFPLIAYSIVLAQLSQKIQRVIVSTDSEEIAEIAKKFGAEVPFMRPDSFSGDKSPDYEFVNHALEWLATHEGKVPEYIVHVRPTTPLRIPSVVDNAIEAFVKSKDATSLRSGHKASESPFKWFLKSEQGFFKSIADGVSNEEANAGRQQFPNVYIPDGYVDVIKTSFVCENGILHGEKLMAFESPTCYEVDEEEDFMLLEYQIHKKGSIIYDYLEDNFADLQVK